MELDDEDLELLGWGAAVKFEAEAAWSTATHEKRLAKDRAREAVRPPRKRPPRPRTEERREYDRLWAAKNRAVNGDKVRAYQREYHRAYRAKRGALHKAPGAGHAPL